MLNATWTILGLTVVCLWSIAWGWRYYRQMKSWKRRATLAEYMLKKIQRDVKADEGHVSVTTEAQLDDVLVDVDTDDKVKA